MEEPLPLITSSVLDALLGTILLPTTGFSVGQLEMAPQSEPGERSHNAQEQMCPPREERALGICSGKWGLWMVAQGGFLHQLLSTC